MSGILQTFNFTESVLIQVQDCEVVEEMETVLELTVYIGELIDFSWVFV